MAFDEEIATLTIYCEASNCTTEEQIAVASVIRNRVGRWQPTVAGVCLQRLQFSEWNDDLPNNKNLLRGANAPDTDRTIQQCLVAYRASSITDPTSGATHYHDKSISPPTWTQNMDLTLETEHFRFYKDKFNAK